MAKIVKKAAAGKAVSKSSKKSAASTLSTGFKKKFSASERADIDTKRSEMRARLYAAG